MALPNILTDKEILGSHIQEVKKMGMEAHKENKSYKLCTEDDHLNEYVEEGRNDNYGKIDELIKYLEK